MDGDAAFPEPACVLVRQHEHPHTVALVAQRADEVVAEQAITACDQDVHVAPSSSGIGDSSSGIGDQ